MDELEEIRKIQEQRFLESRKTKRRNDGKTHTKKTCSLNSIKDSKNDDDDDVEMIELNEESSSRKRRRVEHQPQKDPRLQWLLGTKSGGQASSSQSQQPQPSSSSSSSAAKPEALPVIGECHESPPEDVDDLLSLRVLSWNIDGLAETGLISRTKSVIQTILLIKPDAVYLQEVVAETEKLLNKFLTKSYHIIRPQEQRAHQMLPYYCLIIIAKDKWKILQQETVWFPNSVMGRHLLGSICQSTDNKRNRRIRFMTSHFESMANYVQERKLQLKTCCDYIIEPFPEGFDAAIFGGDLNARDGETQEVFNSNKSYSRRIIDCWEASGKKSETRYTWDMKLNDNLQIGGKPRCRFDRMYWSKPANASNSLSLASFQLVGCWRISNGMFPSDHFGMLATFKWNDKDPVS